VTGTIDVVIVTYRSEGSIERCIASALEVDGLGRVVVVDHGDDASREVAAALGAEVLVDETNPGFAAGQNRGVSATTSPYVLLLNPDATVVPAGIAAGRALLDADGTIGAVQGVVRNVVDDAVERSHGVEPGPVHLLGRALGARRLAALPVARSLARRSRLLADHVERVVPVPVQVDYFAATALLVRRRAFDEVGGFDAGFFLYGEDIDLCRRLRTAGWRLVAIPDPWADHENGASSGSRDTRELHWWRGTMRFAAKWWSTPAWTVGLLAAAIRALRLAATGGVDRSSTFRMLVVEPAGDRRQLR
jgi:GT2 family glycosyltransferase